MKLPKVNSLEMELLLLAGAAAFVLFVLPKIAGSLGGAIGDGVANLAGSIANGAGRAVGGAANAVNPANSGNVFYQAASGITQGVTGDPSFGGWLYDVTHSSTYSRPD